MLGEYKVERWAIKTIIGLGVFMAIGQFFYNRSLWLDEAMLALNILDRSPRELLQPLDYRQAAPILFLEIEKIFYYLIPNSEYGLRLFPLLSFLGSLYFFYKIITTLFKNYYTIVFALCLFVLNTTLIYYSSEVKQYMVDLFVLLLMYYLVLKPYIDDKKRFLLLAFFGSLSISLSNISPIILSTLGLYLLVNYCKKGQLVSLMLVFSAWVFSFLVYYFLFIHNHPSKDFMLEYWGRYGAFLPANFFNAETYAWLLAKYIMLVSSLFKFGWFGKVLLSIFIAIGVVFLVVKKKYAWIILTILPITLHLFLSLLKLYPFDLRLILYIIPTVILLVSFGFNWAIDVVFNRLKINKFLPLSLLIPICLGYIIYSNGYPIERHEIKKSIAYMDEHADVGDKFFMQYFSKFPLEYYQRNGVVSNNIKDIGVVTMTDDLQPYMTTMTGSSGRCWMLFSLDLHGVGNKMQRQLDSLGYTKISEFECEGSAVYLYNMGKK